MSQCLTLACSARAAKASQLGVYRAFVDNYKVAVATADKCCQANAQFAQISEVCHRGKATAPRLLGSGDDGAAFCGAAALSGLMALRGHF